MEANATTVDDRKPINWKDLNSAIRQVQTIGEVKMRFDDKVYVGSGNLWLHDFNDGTAIHHVQFLLSIKGFEE